MTKHSQNISQKIIALAIEFINLKNSEDINFSSYASKNTGYHFASLERQFKKDVGVSISTFIICEKIKMAKGYIKQFPECTMNEISVKCRYKNLSHMTNHFKRFLNITPSQWKKQFKEGKTDQYEDFSISSTK